MWWRLQPHLVDAVGPCGGGCNPIWLKPDGTIILAIIPRPSSSSGVSPPSIHRELPQHLYHESSLSRSLRLTLGLIELGRSMAAWLPLDLLVLLCGGGLETWCWVALLRLLRLARLPSVLRELYQVLRYRAACSVGWARVLSYVPMYALLLHLTACTFAAIGMAQPDGWPSQDQLLVNRTDE